ncbi:MAG: hypothetical protein K9J81_09530 [Desulfohalobiaceae bacterium]|nr:hypothetical protein [Desulfohalobiaceae bacterium]
MEHFKEEIQVKEQQLQEQREQAEMALERGDSPTQHLNQVTSLEADIRTMQGMLPKHEGLKPDAKEQKEIEQLKVELARKLEVAVKGSQALADTQEGFQKKLQELKDLVDDWGLAERIVFKEYGCPKKGKSDFKVGDKELLRFCNFFLGNLYS